MRRGIGWESNPSIITIHPIVSPLRPARAPLLALNPDWSSPLDEQAIRFYFEGGYVPAPYSVFQAIRKLPPAHWLLLNESGLRVNRYWDFRHIETEDSWSRRREADLLDELDEILSRSVRSRMTSDVPLGAFLSAGIDSSVVVAMMSKYSANPSRHSRSDLKIRNTMKAITHERWRGIWAPSISARI